MANFVFFFSKRMRRMFKLIEYNLLMVFYRTIAVRIIFDVLKDVLCMSSKLADIITQKRQVRFERGLNFYILHFYFFILKMTLRYKLVSVRNLILCCSKRCYFFIFQHNQKILRAMARNSPEKMGKMSKNHLKIFRNPHLNNQLVTPVASLLQINKKRQPFISSS